MKSIFVPVLGTESDHASLYAAKTLAEAFGAKIDCIHVRLDPNGALALMTHETSWTIAKMEGERSDKARGEFDNVFAAKPGAGTEAVDAQWKEVESLPLDEYVHRGRMHDLLVVSREKEWPGYCAELVMWTGRPVLVAPPRRTKTIGEAVLIAWNDTPESARAIAASMPILKKAKRVLLVSIVPSAADEGAAEESIAALKSLLVLHGIPAETKILSAADGQEADMLKSTAYDADCDLIVMGAYGHNRLREYVFGGVTREVLKECAVSVLMFH